MIERDYFSEEVGGGDEIDYYSEEVNNEIPKPESVMSRVFKTGVDTAKNSFGLGSGNPLAMKEYREAQNVRTKAVDSTVKGAVPRFMLNMATNPETYAGGGAALKNISKFPGAVKSVAGKAKNFINFGGKKAATKIAGKIGSSMDDVKGGFSKRYDPIVRGKVQEFGQNELKEIASAARSDAVGSTTPDAFHKLADDIMKFDPEQLHNFKQELHKMGARKTYQKVNEVLSRKGVFGPKYSKITSEMDDFINQERNYIDDFAFDKYGKPTESRIKSTTDVDSNVGGALKKFGERTGNPFHEMVSGVKRGQKVKKAVKRFGPWAGGAVAYEALT